ncbi:MAG: hypothetical protein ACFB14_10650 [Leptolyngbyaceae cyanobacterium]
MEQLYERINRALQCDVRRLVRTVDNPKKVLAQMIAEMSADLRQFRQIIDTRIANQQPVEAENNLKEYIHHIAALRSSLLKLETKMSEAEWILSELGGDSKPGRSAGVNRPKSPSDGPSSGEANPEVDG